MNNRIGKGSQMQILEKVKDFVKQTTIRQRITAGVVALLLIVGAVSVALSQTRQVSESVGKVSVRVKADKTSVERKSEAEKQAKLKADAEKQAKLKAEAEAKAKAGSDAKAKEEADKKAQEQAQVVAQQQAQATEQAQAVAEQSQGQAQATYTAPAETTSATSSNTASTPSNTNTNASASVTIPVTPTPSTPTVSDDQKWLNAGYIRAPYPEGSNELWIWLDAHNYSGYTGNGEGWIRPY